MQLGSCVRNPLARVAPGVRQGCRVRSVARGSRAALVARTQTNSRAGLAEAVARGELGAVGVRRRHTRGERGDDRGLRGREVDGLAHVAVVRVAEPVELERRLGRERDRLPRAAPRRAPPQAACAELPVPLGATRRARRRRRYMAVFLCSG